MGDKAAPVSGQGPVSAEEWGPGYELWKGILAWLGQRGPDGTNSLVRVASHVVIVAVSILVLWISRLQLPTWEIAPAAPAQAQPASSAPSRPVGPNPTGNQGLVRAAVPFTLIPQRPRTDIIYHKVTAGDTLYGIAEQYQITADTLVWANDLEQNPDLLRLEQQLLILPVNGVLHTVGPNDTLESIAKKYTANVADIVGFEANHLDAKNPTVAAGQKLIVPGGTKPAPPPKPAALPPPSVIAAAPKGAPVGWGKMHWPTAGYISQSWGRYHGAIDIAAYTGAPVKAADAGYVAVAGWSYVGYGNHIIIDHGNGYQTLYGHLSKILVKPGETVAQDQLIGLMGSTGNSTGPHLHFEVRYGGGVQNPFNYLP